MPTVSPDHVGQGARVVGHGPSSQTFRHRAKSTVRRPRVGGDQRHPDPFAQRQVALAAGAHGWLVERDRRRPVGGSPSARRRPARPRRTSRRPGRAAAPPRPGRPRRARRRRRRRSVLGHHLGQPGQRRARPVRHRRRRRCSARQTSVAYRSASRRSGAVTWAYGGGDGAVAGLLRRGARRTACTPAPRISSAAWSRNAAPRGWAGSRAAMTRPTDAPVGPVDAQRAARRRAAARPPSARGGGIVRSSPTPPSSMMPRRAIPVSSEICALHSSTGSWRAQHQAPAAAVGLDLLLGQRQVDRAAVEAARRPAARRSRAAARSARAAGRRRASACTPA